MNKLILALVVVAVLVGGFFALHASNGQGEYTDVAPDLPNTEYVSSEDDELREEIARMKAQLRSALQSGGMSPETSTHIAQMIEEFERRGASEADITEIREILDAIPRGGTVSMSSMPSKSSSEVPQPASSTQVQETGTPHTESTQNTSSNEPPVKLKNIGVEFTDFIFTKDRTQFNRMFMGFGFVIPGSQSSTGQSKANPQPTFILPLGTLVRSLVDGKVANISKTWAGDYSIQVTKSGAMEQWIFETEHVLNPKVNVGDAVVAGQVIAEVSNFDTNAPAGYGTVEIGILKGGQVAEHVCPFAYLDDSIRESTLEKMRELFASWEAYMGDTTLYNENEEVPGCITLNAIEG